MAVSGLRSSWATPAAICPTAIRENDQVALSIRPENVRLHTERPHENTPNVFPGRVEYVLFLGESAEYTVRVGQQTLTSRQHNDVDLRRGQDVFVEFPTNHCIVVSDEHGTTPDTEPNRDDDDGEGDGQLDTSAVYALGPA